MDELLLYCEHLVDQSLPVDPPNKRMRTTSDPCNTAVYYSSSKSSVDDQSSESYSPPDSDDEPPTENHMAYCQEHLLSAAECGDVKMIKILLSDASTIDINYMDKKVSFSVVFW